MKLLRIVGDVDQSNKQIVANLTEPIKVKANSKIALYSGTLELTDSAINQSFNIVSGANTFLFNGQTITLTVGNYNIENFRNHVNNQISLFGATTSGTYGERTAFKFDPVTDTFNFERSVSQKRSANFANWVTVTGVPNSSGSTFDANGSATDVVQISGLSIPNARSEISGTLTTVDQFTIIAGLNTEFYKMGCDGTNWVYGSSLITGPTANINDTFRMSKVNNVFNYYVNGSLIGTETNVNQSLINIESDQYQYQINANSGSTAVIQNISFADFGNRIENTLTINIPNTRLARYFGFKNINQNYNSVSALTAIVSSDTLPLGDSAVGGILVCVDPFILDSYNVDNRTNLRGRNNILYTIVKRDLNTVVNFEPPYPIKLNLKNPTDTTLTSLTVTFRNEANGNLLQFDDNPTIVLVIYDPDE